jgi:hypothetical protein
MITCAARQSAITDALTRHKITPLAAYFCTGK